jgi:hypothetical protein
MGYRVAQANVRRTARREESIGLFLSNFVDFLMFLGFMSAVGKESV